MKFYSDQTPTTQVRELLDQAVFITGFSRDDIEEMVDSELETSYLLEYINAVLSNRMN
jgi:hypothetical protein